MKLKRIMKKHYADEINEFKLPESPVKLQAADLHMNDKSPLWMHLVFNSAIAVFFILCIFINYKWKNPIFQLFEGTDKEPYIVTIIRQNFNNLPEILKYNNKGDLL